MKLINEDKKQLKENGYTENDFSQIERAMQKSITTYRAVNLSNGKSQTITRERAIEILGRNNWLSGIARSAFHFTAVRENKPVHDIHYNVYFDSSKLFKQ